MIKAMLYFDIKKIFKVLVLEGKQGKEEEEKLEIKKE